MITLIWAMDENWLIGKDNRLPWHYPTDLAYFKKMTRNSHVLMGDLTYQSLKGYYKHKALPFKQISVANLENKVYEDATRVSDIHDYFKHIEDDICVIGGKTIYQLALPYADQLYITFILKQHEGNVYFPSFDLSAFKLVSKRLEPGLIFAVYERRHHK